MQNESIQKSIDELEDVDVALFNAQEAVKDLLHESVEDALINAFLEHVDNARLLLRSLIGSLRKKKNYNKGVI